MSYILDIATAVPEFSIQREDFERFYFQLFGSTHTPSFFQKLNLLSQKTKIKKRYSCIPDYNGSANELYFDGDFKPSVERRMSIYKEKIMPLATKAIDELLSKNNIHTNDITHLITVSCTGVFAPGFEFLVAEHYNLQSTEKSSVNFMGCYAAFKALKQANYITSCDPNACVLIISAELCTLHFYPSDVDEDVVANLLFADGAAATLVCGKDNKYVKDKVVLSIDQVGSAYIPNTLDLMTWDVTSTAFRMFLSKHIVTAIKENIHSIMSDFLKSNKNDVDHWAIHPGGIKIVEAVQDVLQLSDNNVSDSVNVLENYGNMSSPTILFILKSIFNKIKKGEHPSNKKIVSCAFGPGINVEMIRLSTIDTNSNPIKNSTEHYAIQI